MKVRFTFDVDMHDDDDEDTQAWLDANTSDVADYIADTFGPYDATVAWACEVQS